jgi:hypothetical protein
MMANSSIGHGPSHCLRALAVLLSAGLFSCGESSSEDLGRSRSKIVNGTPVASADTQPIVRIGNARGAGSGVVIGDGAWVLTAGHVPNNTECLGDRGSTFGCGTIFAGEVVSVGNDGGEA